MLIKRTEKLALIHTARRELHLSDENYRALLHGAAGVDSAAKLDREDQFDRVMEAFQKLGFKTRQGSRRPRRDDFWRCTPAQRAKIEVLWANMARKPDQQALRRMVARIIHIDQPAWIGKADATKVILALRQMAVQAGLNPDAAERKEVAV